MKPSFRLDLIFTSNGSIQTPSLYYIFIMMIDVFNMAGRN